jgi:hypothetical protein
MTIDPIPGGESYGPTFSGPAQASMPAARPDAGFAFAAIDDVLDLSQTARDIAGTYAALAPGERNDFLAQLADLLKQGIIGAETLKVRGEPYQSFIDVGIADPKLRGAKPWSRI